MDSIIIWSPGVTIEAIEKQVILAAFRFYRGNKTATANALGIAVRTLDNKLEKYEADGKAEKERQENERIKREQFLARSRGGGQVPNNVFTGTETEGAKRGDHATAGVRVESAQKPTAQPTVSVPERKEVQSVLSGKAAAGSSASRR
jgi:hypothetical protein